MSDAPAILSFDNLTITNNQGRVLVDNANFALHKGERLGIVGESGSGKSLSLKAAAGILPRTLQTSGSVAFGEGLSRRDLAMMFQ